MKKILVLAALVMIQYAAMAKIWRVNNVVGVDADFTTADAAHDNVSVLAGDTLHIEPSSVSYGNVVLTKRLTIISTGSFLSANPGLQYFPNPGTLGQITVQAGASGSVFHCNAASVSISLVGVTNLRFERCRITTAFTASNLTSSVITQCFLENIILNTNCTNITISNCIVEENISMANNTTSATITHNVIRAVTYNGVAVVFYNSIFRNNIINKTGSAGITFSNCTVENNISSGSQLPAGNGNQNAVTMANVFVNPSGATDISYRLQTSVSNPAIGAGFGGVDCGAFGGIAAFKPGLQAAVPAIYRLDVPLQASGNTMPVIFSTRSNN